jgi:hypothetical protein
MKQLVKQSLRRPSGDELEAMLRGPLGDPDLRLVFLGGQQGPVGTEPGHDVTLVGPEDAPAVAIIHDPQLNDDPELLEAAGAIALLAAENTALDAGWTEAVHELERSRSRLVRVADDERRKFERNLHDSVQQQLVGIKLRLEMEAEEDAERHETRRARRPRLGFPGRGGRIPHVPCHRRRTGVLAGRCSRRRSAEHGRPPRRARGEADDHLSTWTRQHDHGFGSRRGSAVPRSELAPS